MITATIVDDEPDCSDLQGMPLEPYCPEVKISGICYFAETTMKSIKVFGTHYSFGDHSSVATYGNHSFNSFDDYVRSRMLEGLAGIGKNIAFKIIGLSLKCCKKDRYNEQNCGKKIAKQKGPLTHWR